MVGEAVGPDEGLVRRVGDLGAVERALAAEEAHAGFTRLPLGERVIVLEGGLRVRPLVDAEREAVARALMPLLAHVVARASALVDAVRLTGQARLLTQDIIGEADEAEQLVGALAHRTRAERVRVVGAGQRGGGAPAAKGARAVAVAGHRAGQRRLDARRQVGQARAEEAHLRIEEAARRHARVPAVHATVGRLLPRHVARCAGLQLPPAVVARPGAAVVTDGRPARAHGVIPLAAGARRLEWRDSTEVALPHLVDVVFTLEASVAAHVRWRGPAVCARVPRGPELALHHLGYVGLPAGHTGCGMRRVAGGMHRVAGWVH